MYRVSQSQQETEAAIALNWLVFFKWYVVDIIALLGLQIKIVFYFVPRALL